MNFLDFDRIAAARGDGLHPQMRALLERRAAVAANPSVAEINTGDTGRPAGERPAAAAFAPGNVVSFRPGAAADDIAPACHAASTQPSRG
mgnify:CR=1 FL=1